MNSPKMAFIDMEFGHVCGTRKIIFLPIEVGIVLYDPQKNSISVTQTKIKKGIIIEMWKNSTDNLKRTTGSVISCANLAKNQYDLPYDENYVIEMENIQDALKIACSGYHDLNSYFSKLTTEQYIQTMVFFSKGMEVAAFGRAKIDIKKTAVLDVQDKIKKALKMDKLLSLDRISYALNIEITKNKCKSNNFEYTFPNHCKSVIKPHRALGDAARIFLIYKELKQSQDEVRLKIREYFKQCRNDENNSQSVE